MFKTKRNEKLIRETVALVAAECAMDSFMVLESMQKLDVKDGDVVVIKHPGILKDPARLRETVEGYLLKFGFKVQVMVLEEGVDIGVLRKEETINQTEVWKGFQPPDEECRELSKEETEKVRAAMGWLPKQKGE